MEPTSPPWLAPEAPEAQPEGMLRISDGKTFQVIWPVPALPLARRPVAPWCPP